MSTPTTSSPPPTSLTDLANAYSLFKQTARAYIKEHNSEAEIADLVAALETLGIAKTPTAAVTDESESDEHAERDGNDSDGNAAQRAATPVVTNRISKKGVMSYKHRYTNGKVL